MVGPLLLIVMTVTCCVILLIWLMIERMVKLVTGYFPLLPSIATIETSCHFILEVEHVDVAWTMLRVAW